MGNIIALFKFSLGFVQLSLLYCSMLMLPAYSFFRFKKDFMTLSNVFFSSLPNKGRVFLYLFVQYLRH